MIYEQFLNDVKAAIKEKVDSTYEVSIKSVLKNNSIKLDGLIILKPGERISPNIYLNEYYENLKEGVDFKKIIELIFEAYKFQKANMIKKEDFSFKFDEIKENIYYRIINYSKNKDLLKETPNIKFLDLAITFHCLVNDDCTGIGSIRITREHLNMWDKNIKELHRIARKNTPILFPVKLCSMNDIIADIYLEEVQKEKLTKDIPFELKDKDYNVEEILDKEMVEEFLDEIKNNNQTSMFVLTNTRGINGASSILYKDIIKKFADKIGFDLYILPSSIHETILVPCQKEITLESLSEMVFEVNRTQLAPEEILSDKVYFYNRSTNQIN